MKIFKVLTTAFMLTAATQGFSAVDAQYNGYTHESFGKSKSNNNSKDRKNDRKKDRNHGNRVVTEQGPKGDKGDKGDQGEHAPCAYGFFYLQANGSVDPNSPVIFDTTGQIEGAINYDISNGTFVVSESGDYQISYNLIVSGEGTAAFGVKLKDDSIVSGSVYRTPVLSQSQPSAQLSGTVVASIEAGNNFSIVNLSGAAFNFDNTSAPDSINASIIIKKIK